MSPALAGGFLITVPPGKSRFPFLEVKAVIQRLWFSSLNFKHLSMKLWQLDGRTCVCVCSFFCFCFLEVCFFFFCLIQENKNLLTLYESKKTCWYVKLRGLRTSAIEPFPKRLRESWHAADFPYSSVVVRVRVYNGRKNQNILNIVMIFLGTVHFIFFFFFFFKFLWQHQTTCKFLIPQPGMEPMPSAVKVQSLNHWATRGVLMPHFYSLVS